MRTSPRLLCGQIDEPGFGIRLVRLDAATVQVVVTGDVDLATQHLFARAVEEARQMEPATLLVDLTGVDFFSISALAVLAGVRAAAVESGSAVAVQTGPGIVRRVLRFLELDDVGVFGTAIRAS